MPYNYKITGYAECYDELRGIIGISADDLPNTEIDSMPMLPAADLEVSRLVPTYADIVAANDDHLIDLRMAVLYLGVANILPSLKVRLLAMEDDGKTKGQRFSDALAMKPEVVRLHGLKFIDAINAPSVTTFRNVFDVVPPAIDVITGS